MNMHPISEIQARGHNSGNLNELDVWREVQGENGNGLGPAVCQCQ